MSDKYSKKTKEELISQLKKLQNELRNLKNESSEKKTPEEHSQEIERTDVIIKAIGDGVIATDNSGKITFMNPVAEVLTGWKFDEAEGQPLSKVFKIINTETRKEVVNPVQKVIHEGKMLGLANHTSLISREGKELQISDSASPVMDEKGNLTGIVLIFRDISEKYRQDAELAEREAQYRSIMESTPLGIHVYKLNDKDELIFSGANRAAEKILGVKLSKYVGLTIGEAFPPLLDTEIPERYKEVALTGEPWAIEHVDYQDEKISGAYEVSVFRTRPREIVVQFLDITEKLKTRNALKNSEENLRITLDSIGDGVIATDRDGRVRNINRIAAHLTGWSHEDAEGKKLETIFKIVNSKTRKTVTNPVSTVLETGKIVGLANHTLLISKDGTEYQIADSAAPIEDNDGNISGVVLVFRDVTEDYIKDEKIRENEATLSSIFKSVPSGVGIVKNRKFTWVNEKFCQMLGYSEEDLVGQNARMIYKSDEDYEYVGTEKYRQIAAKGTGSVETQLLTSKGEILDVVMSSTPMNPENLEEGVVFSATDISEIKKTQRELKDSEERYSLAQEAANIGSWDWDVKTGKLLWSETISKIFGIKEGEFGGTYEDFLRYVYKKDLPLVVNKVTEAIEGESEYGIEHRIKRPDGTVRWVYEKGRVHRDDNGEAVRFIGIVQDITERKEAAAALEKEKETAELYFNIADVILLALDDRGIITNINQKGCEVLECSPAETIGKDWFECYLDIDNVEEVRSVFNSMMMGETANTEYVENHIVTKNGNKRHIAWHNKLLIDSDANITGTFSSGLDITEQRLTENKLKKSEERMASFMASSIDGFAVLDENFDVLDINQAALDIFSYDMKPESIIGKNILDIDPLAQSRDNHKHYMEVLKTGKPKTLSYIKLSDAYGGKYVHIRVFKVNEGLGFIITDISMIKKIEDELQKMKKLESLGVLAGGIAHDFNNILAAMLGNISLAKLSINPDNKAYTNLDEAEKAVQQATDLTNQLLTFSKGGAPVKEDADIAGLVRETATFVLRGSKIKCEFHVPDDLWNVEIDKGQINQVINNLVINAVQAMPENRKLDITLENIPARASKLHRLSRGRYVQLIITDYGVGIEPELLDQIFDPYFTTKEKGSGLGLATAHSIIKRHKGEIRVESKLGKGTTFTIFLPASPGKNKKTEKIDGVRRTGSGRILLMDDDSAVLQVAREILEYLGYEVDIAQSGQEAIEKFRDAQKSKNKYKIALLDLTVPGGMGGKQTVKVLKKIDPGIITIATSGYSNDPIMSDYLQHGFDGVISKPYTLDELTKVLGSLIQ